ncbi:MAG: HAD-IB family hydrolase [Ilumatobacteraceae bacterium]
MSSGAAVVDVAAFDVDGTLTVRDCVVPFLVRVGGWGSVAAALGRRAAHSAVSVARRDRDGLKAIVVGGVLRGRRVADVERVGESFAAEVHDRWLRSDTVARLRWHQQSGHLVVLVSASLGQYLRPLGRRLGVDGVLCTEPGTTGDGEFADGLDGGNCRAAEKVRRLESWLADRGITAASLWAYGDSSGDRELLARADHPMLVGRMAVPAVPAGGGAC